MSRMSYQQSAFCFTFLLISFVSAKEDMSKCGISQICIRDPPGCSPDSKCKFIAAFSRTDDPSEMRVRLRAKNTAPRPYVAIRFSDTRIPDIERKAGDFDWDGNVLSAKYRKEKVKVKSTVIYCSPKDRILRFGYERDGRVDFASRGVSDRFASISDSWAKDGIVQCEFNRVITAPKKMLAVQSLTSPLHVQLIAGSISSDGFPMSPNAAYTSDNVVDFGAVKYLPTEATSKTTKSTIKLAAEENISEEQLQSIPEVDESEIPLEVHGLDFGPKKKPKVTGGDETLKAQKNADSDSESHKKPKSRMDKEAEEKSVASKKRLSETREDLEDEKDVKSRKKSVSKVRKLAKESADLDDEHDSRDRATSSSEVDGEKKNMKKKRPILRAKGAKSGHASNASDPSFSLAPDGGDSDEDDEDIFKDEFNSTSPDRAGRISLYDLGTTMLLFCLTLV